MVANDDEQVALDRFQDMIDAYGAEPARWPADRRAWALDVLTRSAAARALLPEAARLDNVIAAARPAPAPSHLVGRVLAQAPQTRAASFMAGRNWLQRLWHPAAGLAFAAILGIGLGLNVSPFPANGLLVAQAETETVGLGFDLIEESEL